MKKLYVVGIGPGDASHMTLACRAALHTADIIVGYTKYVELIKSDYPDKPTITSPMTKEIERCEEALTMAAQGQCVALICSGDAGVYGMAGLIYELADHYPPVDIEIIPGVTAALAGAAILGAPLTHDFAVISLSDLLTPWELIAKRIANAAAADFCLALYNPASKKRHDYLAKACEIILNYKEPTTICGIVRNIGREGQYSEILPLNELKLKTVDMFTTVFIGNSQTKLLQEKMVTPRGYKLG